MIRTTRNTFAAVVLTAIVATGAFAANIAIIESQSFDPSHTMDQEWFNVALNMGHNPTMYPQSSLDNGSFITPNDIVIVASGVSPMAFNRRQMIIECLYAFRPVYLQTERDFTADPNIAWEEMLVQFGQTWTWQGADPGNLQPMYVSGNIANTTNTVPNMTIFQDGAWGSGSGLETTHHWADKEYGWLLPADAVHAMAVTNTDQDWVRVGAHHDLMENYINVLLAQAATELRVRVGAGGPVVIPATGGAFSYTAQVQNTGPAATIFDAWIRIQLPNGNLFGPTQLFTGLSLAPFSSTPVVTLSQFVPGFAPPGNYFLHGVVGNYSWPIKNIDALAFQKVVIAADEADPVQTWQGEGLTQLAAASGETPATTPTAFELNEPYPNPFNPTAQVSVSLPETAPLQVTVYNLHGQEVARLADGISVAGTHEFSFDGSGLASGVYILHAVSPGQLNQSRKLVLMK